MTIDRAALALGFIVGGLAALLGWLWLAERVADLLPLRVRRPVVGLLWIAPALVLVGVYLVWPLANTLVLSLRDAQSRAWRGLDNYRFLAVDRQAEAALRNNLLWLGLLTVGCLGVGLVMATLADQVRYEAWAKAAEKKDAQPTAANIPKIQFQRFSFFS